MATRAMIYIKYFDPHLPAFKGIYCNFDGYLEHTGKFLQEFYNTTESVEKLINEGDISGFTAEGIAELSNDSYDDKKYSEYDSEDSFPPHIDNHYIWDSVENKWYHSEWDYHKWESLEDELCKLDIDTKNENLINFDKIKRELKMLSIKNNVIIDGKNYINFDEALIIFKNILKRKI